MFEVEFISTISFFSLLLFAGKLYHDHMTIKELKKQNEKFLKAQGVIDSDVLKITEALERTFVSRDYLHDNFIGREVINDKFEHLEDTLALKMENINNSLKSLTNQIKGKI